MTDEMELRQNLTIMCVGNHKWVTDLPVTEVMNIIDGIRESHPIIHLEFLDGTSWWIRTETITGVMIENYEKVNIEVRRPRTPPAKSRQGSR